jgi:hypothetical protein
MKEWLIKAVIQRCLVMAHFVLTCTMKLNVTSSAAKLFTGLTPLSQTSLRVDVERSI